MILEDRDEPLVFVDEAERPGDAAAASWRILIVDDEPDVHEVTLLALRDVIIEGRSLSFLHARSAAEAETLLRQEDDIAVVLLDVVMETEDAGLRLGKDVSIITHDDELSYMRNGDSEPIFTATRSSVREAGRLAAQMLLEMIADPPDVLPSRMLDCDLVVGQSTGPGPARGA